MAQQRPSAIDKQHYKLDMRRYYRDFAIDFSGFLLGFIWLLHAEGAISMLLAYLLAVVSIHRASIFGHDIVHHYQDPRMCRFRLLWDYSAGAVSLFPVVRFYKPHLTHHAPSSFRTAADPQYLLLRHNPGFAVVVLLLAPPVLPLVNLLQVVAAGLGGTAGEAAIARFLERRGVRRANIPDARHRREIVARSRFSLALLVLVGVLAPEALLWLYLVLAGGWLLLALHVPLEHGLETLLERPSSWHDQRSDSYTVISPFADILQPHGMKYHTAHHLYPIVPYHNLPRLHAELAARDPNYRARIISLWDAIRGPARVGATVD
ncbi:fatty acid desaturase [Halochromatium sp.]